MTIPTIPEAYQDYYNFVGPNGPQQTDANNFSGPQGKLEVFDTLIQRGANPSFILMMFFTTILAANDTSHAHGLFKPNGASYTRNQENQLTAVSKELNYASAYRQTVSDIKNIVEDSKNADVPNAISKIQTDISTMKTYMDSSKFPKGVPEIFQNSSSTFKTSFDQINGFIDGVNKSYGGSIHAAWVASQEQGDKTAGGLIQTFTNATDTLFSAVGVQQNVLNTDLQDIESNYKSTLSVVTQGMKSFFSVITNALQKMTTS